MLYFLLLIGSCVQASRVYSVIQVKKHSSLFMVVQSFSSLLQSVCLYSGLLMMVFAVYRYAEYYQERVIERVESIVTLFLIGGIVSSLSLITIDADVMQMFA